MGDDERDPSAIVDDLSTTGKEENAHGCYKADCHASQ